MSLISYFSVSKFPKTYNILLLMMVNIIVGLVNTSTILWKVYYLFHFIVCRLLPCTNYNNIVDPYCIDVSFAVSILNLISMIFRLDVEIVATVKACAPNLLSTFLLNYLISLFFLFFFCEGLSWNILFAPN